MYTGAGGVGGIKSWGFAGVGLGMEGDRMGLTGMGGRLGGGRVWGGCGMVGLVQFFKKACQEYDICRAV